MRGKKERGIAGQVVFYLWRLLIFSCLAVFVVTVSLLILFHTPQIAMELFRARGGYVLVNIAFLSILFVAIDTLQRRITIQKPVEEILEATEKLAEGRFDTRVRNIHSIYGRNEYRMIGENLNKLAEELSGIETLRTDFVSNVSHELKTPLAVIGNYSTMLQSDNLTAELRMEYACAISQAARRLSGLITNILKLNKLENQQIYPEQKQFYLGEQLSECLLGFEEVWEEKNIELDCNIEDDVVIWSDPELLSLVWNNLFSNAFKFTEPGGTVQILMQKKGDAAEVTVKDNGCGISKEVGRHIFDKFYQGDSSHAARGNGLGLALVKRVIDIMHAEIAVESVPKEGSAFIVSLPLGGAPGRAKEI